MPTDMEGLKTLVTKGQLAEAFAGLCPFLNYNYDEPVKKEYIEVLYSIARAAVEKGELSLAVQAAAYGEGLHYSIEDTDLASWHSIIQRTNKAGGFPKMPFTSVFLVPRHSEILSRKLNNLSLYIYQLFQNKSWEIPEHDVVFSAHGRSPRNESRGYMPILLRKVKLIRGIDFILGYDGQQGGIEGTTLSNNAGFDFIAIDGVIMRFFSDDSGPWIFEYSGNAWEQELVTITNTLMCSGTLKPDWKRIECYIPKPGQIHINTLVAIINGKKGTSERVYRETGMQIKQKYLDIVEAALENKVLPRLQVIIDSMDKQSSTLTSTETASLVDAMRRNGSPIMSNNNNKETPLSLKEECTDLKY